jgi:hypothetical protein
MSTSPGTPVTSAGGLALDNTLRGCARHPAFTAAGGCECGAPLCSACLRSAAHARCGECRLRAGQAADVVDHRWRGDLLVDSLRASFAALPRRALLIVGMAVVSFGVAAAGLFEAPTDERLREPASLHLAAATLPVEPPAPAEPPARSDDDRDGLDDGEEAALLARVRPECEGPPPDHDEDDVGVSCTWPAEGPRVPPILSDDEDSDRDGLADQAEGTTDADRDGVADFVDPVRSRHGTASDDDDDGIANAIEIAVGSSPFASDSDSDGIPDRVETRAAWGTLALGPPLRIDTDRDGTVDARDTDSDGDGVNDETEARLVGIDVGDDGDEIKWLEVDSDGDGVPNFRDVDDDDDGISTRVELEPTAAWNDSGDEPAYDSDSDDDGVPDWQEAHLDRNANATADEREADDAFVGPANEQDEASRFSMTFAGVMLWLAFLLQPLLTASLVRRSRRRAVLARVAFGVMVCGGATAVGLAQGLADVDGVGAAPFLLSLLVLLVGAPLCLTVLGQVALGLRVSPRGLLGAGVAHFIVMSATLVVQLGLALPLMLIAQTLPNGPLNDAGVVVVVVVAAVIHLVGMGGFAAGSARFSADRAR